MIHARKHLTHRRAVAAPPPPAAPPSLSPPPEAPSSPAASPPPPLPPSAACASALSARDAGRPRGLHRGLRARRRRRRRCRRRRRRRLLLLRLVVRRLATDRRAPDAARRPPGRGGCGGRRQALLLCGRPGLRLGRLGRRLDRPAATARLPPAPPRRRRRRRRRRRSRPRAREHDARRPRRPRCTRRALRPRRRGLLECQGGCLRRAWPLRRRRRRAAPARAVVVRVDAARTPREEAAADLPAAPHVATVPVRGGDGRARRPGRCRSGRCRGLVHRAGGGAPAPPSAAHAVGGASSAASGPRHACRVRACARETEGASPADDKSAKRHASVGARHTGAPQAPRRRSAPPAGLLRGVGARSGSPGLAGWPTGAWPRARRGPLHPWAPACALECGPPASAAARPPPPRGAPRAHSLTRARRFLGARRPSPAAGSGRVRARLGGHGEILEDRRSARAPGVVQGAQSADSAARGTEKDWARGGG